MSHAEGGASLSSPEVPPTALEVLQTTVSQTPVAGGLAMDITGGARTEEAIQARAKGTLH